MKKYILIIGASVCVIGGAIMFFSNTSEAPTQSSESTTDTTPTKGTWTLKELLSRNTTDQTCTFESHATSTKTSGTVYIQYTGSDIQAFTMRSDFETTADTQTITSHMIVKDGMSYVWSDATPQGFKMSFTDMEKPSEQSPQTSQSPNLDETYTYTCAPTVADKQVFDLPSNVTFGDMPAVPTLPKSTPAQTRALPTGGTAQQCSACAQIADFTMRAQCKTALKCD